MALGHVADPRLVLRRVAHVDGAEGSAAPVALGNPVGLGARAELDLGPGVQERVDHAPADTATAAGDRDDLPREIDDQTHCALLRAALRCDGLSMLPTKC